MANQMRMTQPTMPPDFSLFPSLVAWVITSLSGVRRFFFRALLLAMVLAGTVAFVAGIKVNDYLAVTPSDNGLSVRSERAFTPPVRPKPVTKPERNQQRQYATNDDNNLQALSP